jgi:hypothetical protein
VAFLVIRISENPDGKDTAARLVQRSRYGDPTWREVLLLAFKHGYALSSSRYPSKQKWPLTATAYKSPNREGEGRAGSQYQVFRARRLPSERPPCPFCAGTGDCKNKVCPHCEGDGKLRPGLKLCDSPDCHIKMRRRTRCHKCQGLFCNTCIPWPQTLCPRCREVGRF